MSKRSIMYLSIADEDLVEHGERMMVFILIQFIIIGSCCIWITIGFWNPSFCINSFYSFKESKNETKETKIYYSIRRY